MLFELPKKPTVLEEQQHLRIQELEQQVKEFTESQDELQTSLRACLDLVYKLGDQIRLLHRGS